MESLIGQCPYCKGTLTNGHKCPLYYSKEVYTMKTQEKVNALEDVSTEISRLWYELRKVEASVHDELNHLDNINLNIKNRIEEIKKTEGL